MVSSRAWFALATAGVLVLLCVGGGLQPKSGSFGGSAYGQEAKATGLQWQRLRSDEPTGYLLYRSKVPGGWLIAVSPQSSITSGTSITFLPDAEHNWDGSSQK
jgi:hypothetical protein